MNTTQTRKQVQQHEEAQELSLLCDTLDFTQLTESELDEIVGIKRIPTGKPASQRRTLEILRDLKKRTEEVAL